jgi:glycosyltransferase involved in cell wall biosynthesis
MLLAWCSEGLGQHVGAMEMTGSRRASVSVLVPSYGGEDRLPVLLAALAEQEVKRAWEVIVVLDGTPDESRGTVSRFLDDLPLTVIELAENRGRSGALNAGFEASSCDVLLRCDDDLVPPRHFVEGHARHHDGTSSVGVVGFCRNVFPACVYGRAYGIEADERHWHEALARPADQRWLHWATNCSVRRDVWERVGPYDTRYCGWGWEDIDWGYRLCGLGVRITFDPDLTVEHRHSVRTCSGRIERAFLGGQARRRFELIHGQVVPRQKPTLWARLVRLAGRPRASLHISVGRLLDASIAVLPRRCVQRMVAFAVEAADAGGYRSKTIC